MTVQLNVDGKVLTQPGSISIVNANALNNTSLGYSGIVAIMGSCLSGPPKVPQMFTAPGQLAQALGSGNLFDGCRMAFTPSTQVVEGSYVQPQIIYAVRADNATQATLTLLDSASANSVVLTSDDYGTQTNNISVQVGAVSSALVRPPGDNAFSIAISNGAIQEVYNNLGVNPAFSVYYTGAGTASITMYFNNLGTLGVQVLANSNTYFFSYATYPTVSSLVNALNTISGINATASTYYNSNTLAVNALDFSPITTVSTTSSNPSCVFAGIYDAVSQINSLSALVSAVAGSNSGTPAVLPPAPYAGYQYLSGATTTPPGLSDYQACMTALQQYRLNFVAIADACTVSNGYGAAFAAWLDTMQGVNECHGHIGTSIIGQSNNFAALQSIVQSANDPNVNFWIDGVLVPNAQGVPTYYDSWMPACMAAGFQGGTPPGTSFVQKSLSILGTQHYIDPTGDLLNPATNGDQMVLARFSFMKFNDALKAWVVDRALTTYTLQDNDYYTEPGIRSAANFAIYSIRQDIEQKFLGARTLFSFGGSTADSVRGEIIAYSKLLEDDNVIVKASVFQNNTTVILPALIVDSVTISGDVLRARYELRPIGSVNFIVNEVTLNAVQQAS